MYYLSIALLSVVDTVEIWLSFFFVFPSLCSYSYDVYYSLLATVPYFIMPFSVFANLFLLLIL